MISENSFVAVFKSHAEAEIAHAQEIIRGVETEVSKQHPIETKLLT